jgi:2,4-dienoyl-CoA reductase-like NADH-dependent reductase (Old Yellow Enzyme family)
LLTIPDSPATSIVPHWTRIKTLKTAEAFRAHLASLAVTLPFDEVVEHGPAAPLAQPIGADGLSVGNRFCILPMEGWDGSEDGRPSDLTRRRWEHFGQSGAKLIWGGEAVAVQPEGRANPNQLVIAEHTLADLESLRERLVAVHRERYGAEGLVVGLQLTHSGRYSRPTRRGPAPRVAYRHPVLDARVGVTSDDAVMRDEEIDALVESFVTAAGRAAKAGFDFVDVKHCHGYFGHELLSGRHRPGRYGGSLENRLRFVRDVVAGIRAEVPGLHVGVRLSIFDMRPYMPGPDGSGVPAADEYDSAFGLSDPSAPPSIEEASAVVQALESIGVHWICATAGSPYYNPHVQRPALFPPSDGYEPPEDPTVGVARQVDATARLKARHPGVVFVGSAYSYLQEWLPNVAQRVVRDGLVDLVGIGRLVLSYPEFPADVLAGRPLAGRLLCRTFSDCTTAPRNGLVSGCYPLDPLYLKHPAHAELKRVKAEKRG